MFWNKAHSCPESNAEVLATGNRRHPNGARSAVPKHSPERAPLAVQRRAGIRDRLQEARKRLGAAQHRISQQSGADEYDCDQREPKEPVAIGLSENVHAQHPGCHRAENAHHSDDGQPHDRRRLSAQHVRRCRRGIGWN